MPYDHRSQKSPSICISYWSAASFCSFAQCTTRNGRKPVGKWRGKRRNGEEEDGHDHETAHADEDGHDHADEEDAAVSNAAAHEDDAADHTVVAAPDGHDAHEHGEYDPHVWLDPMNAKQEMQNICEAFSKADPEHRADYQANYEKWAKQLDELDKTYQTTLENLSERNMSICWTAGERTIRQY